MNCLQCAHLDLRKHPKHAEVGLGQCKEQKLPGVFEVFISERKCRLFAPAESEIFGKRMKWWESKRGK